MSEPIVHVGFNVPGDHQPYRHPGPLPRLGKPVVVPTPLGLRLGIVRGMAPNGRGETSPIERYATEEDVQLQERYDQDALAAHGRAQALIRESGVPIKLIRTEKPLSGSRLIFYFVAEDPVDYQALVHRLAQEFQTRIEMQPLGARDAARFTGGLGTCGKTLCCSTWLPEFQPVSIKMAKDQDLALNLENLSGVCGRLKCCLRYEHAEYRQAKKELPKLASWVSTPVGPGRVVEHHALEQRVLVELKTGSVESFAAASVRSIAAPTGI